MTVDNRWQGKSWYWFGISHASWLTIPRIVLQSMPNEWQEKFFGLLDEIERTIEVPEYAQKSTTVSLKENGKFVHYEIPSYRHNILPLKKGKS